MSNEPSGEHVCFRPPKGWSQPETDGSDSGTFDLVCSFKPEPDGRVTMTKFGEAPMQERQAKEKAPDYKQYGQSIVEGATADDSGSGMGY